MKADRLFAKLGTRLQTAIPKAVARAAVPTPLWSVRLYYYDTHAPCAYFYLGTLSTAQRDKIMSKRGLKAPYYLWASADASMDGPRGLCLPSDLPLSWSEFRIGMLFSKVYKLLGDDDVDYMIPYRAMVQQVARKLNASCWPSS